MIGSLLTRGITLLLGYIYPAYECFKSVEQNRPDIHQLRFWCQYWMIIAIVTVLERLGDTFVSWLPMYSEAKLAFIVYLWYPKTRGTTYVYSTFLKPLVARHELEIDRKLNELKARAGDMTFIYWQKSSSYIQTRFFELLQYIASQSQSSRSQATELNVHAQVQTAAPPVYQAQAGPGRQPPPGYQISPSHLPSVGSQAPAAQQPTAPAVPVEYAMEHPPAASHPPAGVDRQAIHREEDMDFEVMGSKEQPVPLSTPEPATRSSFYMTRSRQRVSRRQQYQP